MKEVLVIGADHYNTLWLVRSLGMIGFSPIVVIVSHKNKSFVAQSKYCNRSILIHKYAEVITTLLSLTFNERIVVIASGDKAAEILDLNLEVLSKKYILHTCNNKEGGIVYWMNKTNMLSFAKQCGLHVPITKSIDLAQDCVLTDIPYPCLIKPEVSANSTKDSFRICHDEQELSAAIIELRLSCPRVILQEFIQPEYECLIYGMRTTEEILLSGYLKKLHTCSDCNNLGMMSYAVLSSDMPPQLAETEPIFNFIKGIGYIGIFSVEFLITKDKAYFLEMNMRNDGTCYITTQAGINVPGIWTSSIYEMDTKSLPRFLNHKYTYGMNEINYFKYTIKKVGLIRTIRDVLNTSAFSIFKLDDIKPVIYKFLYYFF